MEGRLQRREECPQVSTSDRLRCAFISGVRALPKRRATPHDEVGDGLPVTHIQDVAECAGSPLKP